MIGVVAKLGGRVEFLGCCSGVVLRVGPEFTIFDKIGTEGTVLGLQFALGGQATLSWSYSMFFARMTLLAGGLPAGRDWIEAPTPP